MCVALGRRYADFNRPLREAAERESQKYRTHVRADDQLFVMHRSPPRGVTGDIPHFWDVDSRGHDTTHYRNNLCYVAQLIFNEDTAKTTLSRQEDEPSELTQ